MPLLHGVYQLHARSPGSRQADQRCLPFAWLELREPARHQVQGNASRLLRSTATLCRDGTRSSNAHVWQEESVCVFLRQSKSTFPEDAIRTLDVPDKHRMLTMYAGIIPMHRSTTNTPMHTTCHLQFQRVVLHIWNEFQSLDLELKTYPLQWNCASEDLDEPNRDLEPWHALQAHT